MKPQDILFLIAVLGLAMYKKPMVFLWAGILSFSMSMPLFFMHIFFTAERLTWYGAFFVLMYIVFSMGASDKVK